MRTLHFVENYLQVTETFIYNYICKSAGIGEAAIVTFDIINREQFPLPEGVRIYQLKKDPAFSRRHLFQLHWLLLGKVTGRRIWYRELERVIGDFQPDVVHCHFGVTGVYFTDFSRFQKRRVPYITNFYGYDASELPRRDKVYAQGLTRLWQDGNWMLAEGPAMGQRLELLGAPAGKVRLSPIIIDGRKYPVKNERPPDDKTPIRFLLIGRFVEKKGFHLFLEAIGRIKDELPAFKIILIGSGPLEETYRSIIERYKLEALVSFEGMKKLSECMQYMLECDVLVQSSVTASNGDSEGGAPTILIEAQMTGIPVIASTHADIPFVMGYHDFLAKEGDVADLSRVIRSFMHSNNLSEKIRMGRKKAAEQHDMNVCKTYQELLLEFSLC